MHFSRLIVAIILSIGLISIAWGVETVDKFNEVVKIAQQQANLYGVEKVLVVLDIDNTLLAMDHPLGSDQWYQWQKTLDKDEPGSVKPEFSILEAQGLLYSISAMHPPETNLPNLIRKIQNQRFTILILTSRGYDFRDATQRELKNNHYNFSLSALSPKAGFGAPYRPFYPGRPEDFGLTQEDIERFGLKSSRLVSYQQGIFMTAGQHKGIMLRTLLAKTENAYSVIVFVDDHEKHVIAMEEAFDNTNTKVIALRYTAEDANVRAFEDSDKQEVITAWENIAESVLDIRVEKEKPKKDIKKNTDKAVNLLINEFDVDTPGKDNREFIELYDGGKGNTDLSGYSVVLFNGYNDTAYLSFDLKGYHTNKNGYFVIGNRSITGAGLIFDDNLIQNGADAIALYYGNTPNKPTTEHLIDAVTYGTDDDKDQGLAKLIQEREPQINENSEERRSQHSNQRCPNGVNKPFITSVFIQARPSPNQENNCD